MYNIIMMRLLVFFFIIYICEQGNGTIYQCNPNASCGCSTSSTLLTRIVGGETAAQGSWSWAVSLRYYGSHFCGGSVLSPLFIITAAHCIQDITTAGSVTIVVGSVTLDTSSSNKFYQTRSIVQIYKHPNYDPNTQSNDLALLRLSSPLNMTVGNIKPICLPSGTTPQPPDNIDMIAVGWGVTSMFSNIVSSTLQQVTVQSISKTSRDCLMILYDSQLQFCAGISTGGKGNTSMLA
jgi:secreted trypsin-like serine protease